MPQTKKQEIVYTVMMVCVMVYGMVAYNIVLNTGAMTNSVFLSAFRELTFMGPIAFVLDFFLVSKLAFACANRMVDFRSCHPFSMILAISVASIAFMCPLMRVSTKNKTVSLAKCLCIFIFIHHLVCSGKRIARFLPNFNSFHTKNTIFYYL